MFNPYKIPSWSSPEAAAHDPIQKRSACSNAFGANWYDSACTPGNTICCVNTNQTYPQCQQYLGLGYCCVEYEEGCYVDLTSSCGQPGAVACPSDQLSAGTSEACCPQYYTCATGYLYSEGWVRCNIQQTAIQSLGAVATPNAFPQAASSTGQPSILSNDAQSSSTRDTATTSSTTLSTTSSTTSSTKSSTTSGNAQGSTHQSPASGLTGGDIAGISIAPVVAVLIIVGLAWWYWRKRTKKPQWQQKPSQSMEFYGPNSPTSGTTHAFYGTGGIKPDNATELTGAISPSELRSTNAKPPGHMLPPHELEGDQRRRTGF